MRVWICSECHQSGMSTFIDQCPHCEHYRCSNCDVYITKGSHYLIPTPGVVDIKSTSPSQGVHPEQPSTPSESQKAQGNTTSQPKSDFREPHQTEPIAQTGISFRGRDQAATRTVVSVDSGYASMISKSKMSSGSETRDSDSVLSSESKISTTSPLDLTAGGGAADVFVEILLNDDEVRQFVEEGFARMVRDRFERNFARLLKDFAAELRKEANPGLQKGASAVIHMYRAYVTSLIRRRVLGVDENEPRFHALESMKSQKRSTVMLERFMAQQQITDVADRFGTQPEDEKESDSDSLSDDGQQTFPNIEMITDFLVSSKAFENFKIRLGKFVGSTSRLHRESSSEDGAVANEWKVLELINQVKNSFRRFLRPPVPPGFKRVEWTCGCESLLYMDFVVDSPGSLETIEALKNQKSTISRPVRGPQSPTQTISAAAPDPGGAHSGGSQNPVGQLDPASSAPSTLGSGSFGLRSRVEPTRSSNTVPPSASLSFFELCVNKGNSKSLAEINVSLIRTDGDFFHKVREHYLQLRSFRARFWLLKPARVSWVRFSVENHYRVGILHKPRALPPKPEVDQGRYIYHPCPLEDELPIDPDVFIHHVFCSVPCPNLIWFPRIPRKLQSSIFASNEPVAYGWGVHIDERPHLRIILLLNVGFIAGSIMAAILWDHFKGDLQGAMGLATLIVMLLNTIMVYYILKWNEE